MRVRDIKEWYVDYLVGLLLEEDSDHEDIAAPLLVIKKAQFENLCLQVRWSTEIHSHNKNK